MGRAPCCDKSNVKRGPWSPDEDAKLKSFIEQNGTGGNWIALPQKIGLKRCGKSCRLRWLNYLRPNIKHGGFSEEEDSIICSLYIAIGSRWSIIAAQLPGRTDNDIKNYWNTRLKKKLLGKQRKEHHHQSRRALGGPNQEIKTLEEGTPLMVANDGDRSSYWPEPVYMTKPMETHISDHHASMRKLLIKLGGRFSSDDREDHAIYNKCVNPVVPSVDSNSFIEASSMSGHMAEGPTSFPSELDDVFYFNSTRLEGLDCFYGGGGMINESTPTGAPETLSWSGEYCPLLYPPPASAYQAMQQQYLSGAPVHLEAQ